MFAHNAEHASPLELELRPIWPKEAPAAAAAP